jgi:catechol 2,3-dioxygenase-like lactoylglutathione lyase family enzyme
VVEGLHHVTIAVRELERAKQFYGGLLALREIERPAFNFSGAWYALGDRQLHLIVNDEAGTLRDAAPPDSRESHFAVRVSDWEATVEHLQANGLEVLARPQNPTPWKQAYVADPDGNVVELNADRNG